MSEIEELQEKLRKFTHERDWEQFHTPENLAKSICIEAGELLELFQWGDIRYKIGLEKEVADIAIYLLMLADVAGIDLRRAVEKKIESNTLRYPVEKCRGRATKAEDL